MRSTSYPIRSTTSPGSASCPNEAPSSSIASGDRNVTRKRYEGSSGKSFSKVVPLRSVLEETMLSAMLYLSGLAKARRKAHESSRVCWKRRPYALTALQVEKAQQLDLRLQTHSACMKLTL
eukprot:6911-Heterococcus_DN1.PRE.8